MLMRKGARTRPIRSLSSLASFLASFALCAAGVGLAASPALAEVLDWTQRPTFLNRVVYTVDIDCTGGGLVCAELDAYSDTQFANITAGGQVDVDLLAGTVQFLQDSTQDVGAGPQPAYATLDAADMTFAEIPFVGAPQTEQGIVFALTNPLFDAGQPLTAGTSLPVSAVVSYSAFADIVGPVDAWVPDITITPSDVTVTGDLEVTAILPGGRIAFTLSNLTGQLAVSNPTTLLGEDVTVNVNATMILNLTANNFNAPAVPLPALGGWATAALSGALALLGAAAVRRRATKGGAR